MTSFGLLAHRPFLIAIQWEKAHMEKEMLFSIWSKWFDLDNYVTTGFTWILLALLKNIWTVFEMLLCSYLQIQQLEILIQYVWGWAQKYTLLNSSPGNSNDNLLNFGNQWRRRAKSSDSKVRKNPDSSLYLPAVSLWENFVVSLRFSLIIWILCGQ